MAEKKKTRKVRGRGKGPEWERKFSKDLSLWWSGGKRDDIFWRTSNSGGRATGRGKRQTFGQYGDIQATDPVGQDLLDVICFELKCGYPNVSFLDLIEDKPPIESLECWIRKAVSCAKESGAPHWAIVWKRTRRQPILMSSLGLFTQLVSAGSESIKQHSRMMTWTNQVPGGVIITMRLSDWFQGVSPSIIRKVKECSSNQ